MGRFLLTEAATSQPPPEPSGDAHFVQGWLDPGRGGIPGRENRSLSCGGRNRQSAEGHGEAQDTVLTATFLLSEAGRVPFPSVPEYAHRERETRPLPLSPPHEAPSVSSEITMCTCFLGLTVLRACNHHDNDCYSCRLHLHSLSFQPSSPGSNEETRSCHEH